MLKIVKQPAGLVSVLWVVLVSAGASAEAPGDSNLKSTRPRAAMLGIRIGVLPAGKLNAITDVDGVRVGHATLIEGDDVRTGVTIVIPHAKDVFQQKVPAAVAVGNGFGKFVGSTQVAELGVLETPIGLTNTLSTFAVADALVRHALGQPGNGAVRSVNPVVGECNDGALNDIRAMRVRARHVRQAIEAAQTGAVDEGSVGAGAGTRCMGWKGGIGTASRVVPRAAGGYTVGVLVQTNFNGILTIAGAPVGRELGRYYMKDQIDDEADRRGSCIVVTATDAPLDARQLRRLAQRTLLGLAAVGSPMTHGSGEYAVAFSANQRVRVRHQPGSRVEVRPVLRDEQLSPLFLAAREATEEAVVNSLLRATAVTGFRGHRAEAIPIDRVVEICKRFGVIRE